MDKGWIFVYRRHEGDVHEYMSDTEPEGGATRFNIDMVQVARILWQILMML